MGIKAKGLGIVALACHVSCSSQHLGMVGELNHGNGGTSQASSQAGAVGATAGGTGIAGVAGTGGGGGASVGGGGASVGGGGGAEAAAGGAPQGGAETDPTPIEPAKNYQLNWMMPQLGAALATKPGKLTYTKLVIQDLFLAESCSIADYNNDGIPDVSSGRIWYEGTDNPKTTFKTRHAFRDGHGQLPTNGTSEELSIGVSDDWADYPLDVNGDGNMDIVNVASPDVNESAAPTGSNPGTPNKIGTVQPHATAYWYENPGADKQAGDPNWAPHLMHADVRLQQHGLVDIDGDGFPELLGACKSCTPSETKGYYQADRANPTGPWTFHSVTIHYTFPYGDLGKLNGIGAGDVDGDGRADLLERGGIWLQQPSTTAMWNQTICTGNDVPSGCGWIAEKTPLLPTGLYDGLPDGSGAKGSSQIYAADIDGDGLTDIVAAEWVYGEGLSWYRQIAGKQFVKYPFLGKSTPSDIARWGAGFAQPVAVQVADMDGDGVPDVVTGKMHYALPLNQGLPDPNGTPYIYVFKNVRGTVDPNSGGPVTLKPVLVDPIGTPGTLGTTDGGMGVGRQIAIGHVNTDGILDMCVASKVGLAVFLGQ